MMEPSINTIQANIMRRLFEQDGLRFAEINVEKIPSDQFAYHLRQLAKKNLIERLPDQTYRLSIDGKTRAIMLYPGESKFIEQGFVAVLILAQKTEQGKELFLMQERNKVPYKGTLALSGDKIHYGEDTAEAAKRAFTMQTGLSATVELRSIWHIKDRLNAEILQDKYFFVHKAKNIRGDLKPIGITGSNCWMSHDEIAASRRAIHGCLEIIESAQSLPVTFHETTFEVSTY